MRQPISSSVLPVLDLRGFTSPLHLLPRLSEEVGVEIWAKRDDVGTVGLAGNKVRKLEAELAFARASGATHIVTEGSRMSNATRAAAAAASALGLRCTLVLCHEAPSTPVGNLLLDALFGADLRLVGDMSWAELERRTGDVVRELEAAGERVHRLPIGCATQRGAANFANAYMEAADQIAAQGASFQSIVHASSAGSTHAGLVLGRTLCEEACRVLGVVVAEDVYEDAIGTYARLANDAARHVGASARVERSDIELTHEFIGDGYGRPAPGVAEAIDLCARLEGMVVDPVYTAKAMAALIALTRRGELRGPVLFWHTGGYHALFDPSMASATWRDVPRLASIAL